MGSYYIRFKDLFLLSVPKVSTKLRKNLNSAAPVAWNQFQNHLTLQQLVALKAFKVILNDLEAGTSDVLKVEKCFDVL